MILIVTFRNTPRKYLGIWAVKSGRCISSMSPLYKQDQMKIESSPPERTTEDWIGPADADSNIRPYKLHRPKNETPLQRKYRTMRLETQEWNQQYWAQHNRRFMQQKEEFIKSELERLGKRNREDGSLRKLSAEELSVFYKNFLDEHYEQHKRYNSEWYKRNFAMLWPAFRLALRNIVSR